LQDHPNFTQIAISGLKKYHLATLISTAAKSVPLKVTMFVFALIKDPR
jgi:hypothetical protein